MDIKMALSGNLPSRKRKASSPDLIKPDVKAIKLNNENDLNAVAINENCSDLNLKENSIEDINDYKENANLNVKCDKHNIAINLSSIAISQPESCETDLFNIETSKNLENTLFKTAKVDLPDKLVNKEIQKMDENIFLSESSKLEVVENKLLNLENTIKNKNAPMETSNILVENNFIKSASVIEMPNSPISENKFKNSSISGHDCFETPKTHFLQKRNLPQSNTKSPQNNVSDIKSGSETLESSLLSTTLNSSSSSSNDRNSNTSCELVPKTKCDIGCTEASSDKLLHAIKPCGIVKKKKKMTYEEAKQKAREREELKKQREIKRKAKEAMLELKRLKKEQKQKEKEQLQHERQLRKEQEEKEKLQRIKEREEKLKIKLEERKRKELQRQKREEELKQVEEERKRIKLEKEQKEKEKQEKIKAAFAKFFVKNNNSPSLVPVQPSQNESTFLPFQVTNDMSLAPIVPSIAQQRFNKELLDTYLQKQDEQELYLEQLKSGKYQDIRQRKKIKKKHNCEADVIIINKNEQSSLGLNAKLLQFCENVRPPYWGTWRKKSQSIRPRNPYGKDEILDYTIDSDEEWDEGGPGESLSGTENEVESEDDYEVDNEFFVPHGYLSAEEEEAEGDEEVADDPEKLKARLKLKLQEFEIERKKKTKELKPIILGCYFDNVSCFKDDSLQTIFEPYGVELINSSPIPTKFMEKLLPDSKNNLNSGEISSPSAENVKSKRPVPEEALPHLIRLLHGNINSRNILIKEFQKFWIQHCQQNSLFSNHYNIQEKQGNFSNECKENDILCTTPLTSNDEFCQISKRQLDITITKISAYGKCPNPVLKKYCWWVHEDILKKYGLTDLPIPNNWNYISHKENDENLSCIKPPSLSIKDFLNG